MRAWWKIKRMASYNVVRVELPERLTPLGTSVGRLQLHSYFLMILFFFSRAESQNLRWLVANRLSQSDDVALLLAVPT
jgi:hypothetical protein